MPARPLEELAETAERSWRQAKGAKGGFFAQGRVRRSCERLAPEQRAGRHGLAGVEAGLLPGHVLGPEEPAERPFGHHIARQNAPQ